VILRLRWTAVLSGLDEGETKIDVRISLPDSDLVTIELARDVEAYLQEQVEAGVCASASELVNDAIRSLRELQRTSLKITPELEAWLLESADKPSTPLTKRDFTAIRERVRVRTGSTAP
jgi:Arc/MetJ-type ribon-helix-helix transcriptional regulator